MTSCVRCRISEGLFDRGVSKDLYGVMEYRESNLAMTTETSDENNI
jgi:hypothetical protein